jgi:hypothetical protein
VTSRRAADLGWRRTLLVIVVLAAVTRVALIVATPHFAPWGDPADYQLHAASIAAGHGYPTSAYPMPGTTGEALDLDGINWQLGTLLAS